MFFIFGISSKEKDIEFIQTLACPNCDSYGSLKISMTYSYFSLFFIPIIKWNKKYYVRKTCCGSLYTIENELGKDIESGQINKIRESNLIPVKIKYKNKRLCSNCNYSLDSDYEYCPKCGKRV